VEKSAEDQRQALKECTMTSAYSAIRDARRYIAATLVY